MSNLLEVRDLKKSYVSGNGRLEILSDLGLEIEEGEMLGITGVSGSGKSTLLHLLGGMDRQDEGSIKIAGQEIIDLTPMELADFRNRTIGFIFQFHHLLPEFTSLENVMMPLLLRGIPQVQAIKIANELLSEVGLSERTGHRPGELSGGEQQRTAMARALIGKPRLLLADEPTGNLDTRTGKMIAELLLTLHANHRLTSIIVTHNENLAAVCTRVLHLENGKLS